MKGIHELLQPNDRVFWSNGKHTVYVNTRENFKILDHENESKIDYFNEVYANDDQKIVPKRVQIWCRKLHRACHTHGSSSTAIFYETTKVRECPHTYELIEYGKVKR